MCRDTRHLNFICHSNTASDFVSFDPDWTPMKMNKLMNNVMTDDNLAIYISTPVISSRDNVDLKSIIELIENEFNKNQQMLEDKLELQNKEQTIIEFPPKPKINSRSGRKIVAPQRLTY